jgi:beta-glucosidase-like glycosyl hydrolase
MELRSKIARLVMSSLSNRDGDDLAAQFHRLREEVLELGIGGYAIFGGNVDSTLELVGGLAKEAPQPLLVASDLERGLGQQLEGGTVFPTQMALGAAGVPDLAYAQGWATGREARDAGISLVFSPVADVASEILNPIIGVRAFGGDPQMVAEMTTAFVRGCQHAGAAATAKHFPGHGDTRLDSHIELPIVDAPRSVLDSRELVPFRAAIRAGVRCVMTAHVAYPGLTRDATPATLSRTIVASLLRDQLGFEGVVVTDALLMGAIKANYGSVEAALAALEAGADILLMPVDIEETIVGLRNAVDQGRLTEERIDESLARIDELHKWIGDYLDEEENHLSFPPELDGAFAEEAASSSNHRAEMRGGHSPIAGSIARRAATLIRDEEGLVPIGSYSGDVREQPLEGKEDVLPNDVAIFALADSDTPVNLVWFRCQLEARLPGVSVAVVHETCSDADQADLAIRASEAETVLIAVFDDVAAWKGRAGPSEALLTIARRLIGMSERVITVGFAGPQLALSLPRKGAFLCCYDGSLHSQCAAVECVFGERPIVGRLPIALPPLYGVGWGIMR